ncbi:MAG: 50S ribosomal protein L22 [Rubrobacteraceae bacterium]
MKAVAKYVRIAPRKARLVADEIRGKSYPEAINLLQFTNKRAARIVGDVLNSAAANAEHNDGIDPVELFVREIRVDEGPTIKRYRARAMGRATMIRKRTSHISVKLGDPAGVLVGGDTDTPGNEEE